MMVDLQEIYLAPATTVYSALLRKWFSTAYLTNPLQQSTLLRCNKMCFIGTVRHVLLEA
jgi:hypothetical protein